MEKMASHFPISGIGISLCSLINHEHTGASISVNAPALNGLDIKNIISTRLRCPVRVINDVNAYARAEYHFGAGRGVNRLLCLGLGTGLAIAVILEGKVLETWAGVAADAGRIVLDPDADVRCAGGVRGSAEAFIGTAAIERSGFRKYRRVTSAREIIESSFCGEPVASGIMAEVGAHTGHLLAVLSPIFFPRKIVITGGTAEAGEPLFQAIKSKYEALIGKYMKGLSALETGQASQVEIVKGELGSEASILGAVYDFNGP
jgi:glucokinase